MACPNGTVAAGHALSRSDLVAFATSCGVPEALGQLRAAQVSKNKLLLAAVMRQATGSGRAERALTDAYQLLREVERRDPAVLHDVVAAPQFGAWATDSARLLRGGGRGGEPLWTGPGHLAVHAAAAAFRAGIPFEIDVPQRTGTVTFPGVGTARLEVAAPAEEWATVRNDDRGGRVSTLASTVWVSRRENRGRGRDSAWSPEHHLSAEVSGLRLAVTLDCDDPFLDRYGAARARLTRRDVAAWERVLTAAWRELAGSDRNLATLVARTVRVLVPVVAPAPTRFVSATDAWSFGAHAMSLPADGLAMAEALVHESQHAVLAAITELVPLVHDRKGILFYAPWREDPRPVGALLQGVYPHYMITRFWRGRRMTMAARGRLRCDVEFGRWRSQTERAAGELARSGALTEAGEAFIAAIRERLAGWRAEPVGEEARGHIADVTVEHRARWRLRHLVPDEAGLAGLADAWCTGARPSRPAAEVGAALVPGPLPRVLDNARGYALAARYSAPGTLRAIVDGGGTPRLDPADALLATGRY
ncbi:MAG: HEXXH motif domain-containing protein, partial [Trebonia sp.]